MADPVLDYGCEKPPVPLSARISGWIGLISAAVIQPLFMHQVPDVIPLTAFASALLFGAYGAIASRGRSIPAWGALAAILFNFISSAFSFS